MRGHPLEWTPPRIKAISKFILLGLSYSKIGKRFGCSKVAIAGAVRRHVYKIPDKRPPEDRHRRRRKRRFSHVDAWTERALTETWTERKARRAQEASHG